MQTKLNDRVTTYTALTALQKKARHLPVVSADANAAVPDLPGFPGPAVIESGKAAISKVQAQSLELEKMANEMNKHELLVAGSLPNPADTFTFQRKYQEALDKTLPDILKSTPPPTAAEIASQQEALRQKIYADAEKNKATGELLFKDAVETDAARQVAELPDQMRKNSAQQFRMYMAKATALDRVASMAGGTSGMAALPAEDIWIAQLGLWIQEDVCKGISEANGQSEKVATSPVEGTGCNRDPAASETVYAVSAAGGSAAPAVGAAPTAAVAAIGPTEAFPKD